MAATKKSTTSKSTTAKESTAEKAAARAEAAKLDAQADEQLRNFKDFSVKRRERKMGIAHDPRIVGHVPSDRCVTWATTPTLDDGQHMSFIKSLGFRPVRIDEVSHDENDTHKLHVMHFEETERGLVEYGGGVLMIGYRKYRDQRRAFQRAEFQQMLDNVEGKTEGVGVGDGRITVDHKSEKKSLEGVAQ